jgi:hypothetical protein
MKIQERKPTPIREVRKLPKRAVIGEVIRNKADGFYYIGIRTQEGKQNGSDVEKDSV